MHKNSETAYCLVCEAMVSATWVDEGIGPYEYAGAAGVHTDWVLICRRCGHYCEESDTASPLGDEANPLPKGTGTGLQ